MSSTRIISVQCPKCQLEKEVKVYDSLNVVLQPQDKEDLLQGRINLFECTQCDFKGIIPIPLLYLDHDQEICVQYYPPSYLDDTLFLEGFRQDGTILVKISNEMEIPQYIRQWHIVFALDEMVRYINFRERVIKNLLK